MLVLMFVAASPSAAANDRCEGCATYISVPETLALRASRPALRMVDVRPAPTYAEVDLAGVVRMTPLVLRTQAAWRDEPLVLLGSGAGYRALEGLRDTLRAEGFADVRILDGGVQQWLRSAEARTPDLDLMLIDPARLSLIDEPEGWTVLDLSAAPRGGLGRANYVAMDGGRPEAAARAAASAWGARAGDLVPNLLVIGDDDAVSTQVVLALARQSRGNVFALREGWTGWDAHQRLHNALAAARGGKLGHEVGGQCW